MTNLPSVLLICLNDEDFINECLKSIFESDVGQVIVVDGGSSDKTIEIVSKYPVKLISGYRGMRSQTMAGLDEVCSDFVFLAESDHFYPPRFINNLVDDLLDLSADAVQGRLGYKGRSNFFEIGHAEFMRIHNKKTGRRSMISGPQMWRTDKLIELFSHISGGENYSFDTERADWVHNLKMRCYVTESECFESGDINFIRFMRRHINYGRGDCDFFKNNNKSWSFRRKMISLTHVIRRYVFVYPLKSILDKDRVAYSAVAYFWLIFLVRYLSFVWECVFGFKRAIKRS